jgi:carbamate kinase
VRIAVIAIGGNSLIRAGERGTVEEQKHNLQSTCEGVAAILQAGYHVVVTHGNGPQVGAALLRSEAASDQVPPQPLDMCGAETQGSIGYLLQQSLQGTLGRHGMGRPVVTVITQTMVARRDPAFRHPTKPVGPFFSKEEAEKRREELGWDIVEDANRGYRRVVASPEPKAIVELLAIQKVLETGAVVISCGGGGIPVILEDVQLLGIEAVIDKDRASSLLASQLGAELFIVSTGVDQVAVNFGKPEEKALDNLTAEEARRHHDDGQFPAGSMGPKIEAAINFLDRGGEKVIITSPEKIPDALAGKAGTKMMA